MLHTYIDVAFAMLIAAAPFAACALLALVIGGPTDD